MGKKPVNAKGKIVGKGTPSEGIMIYNDKSGNGPVSIINRT